MSQNKVDSFISLLMSGNIHDMMYKYYDDNVKVILNKNIAVKKKMSGIDLLQQTLSYMQILQFKVVDIRHTGNKLSYGIYLVTKDQDNSIDFSEHHIVNTWKDNLIYQHNHIIINH